MEAASSLCTPCAGRYGFERTHTPGSMCTSAWTPCRRRSSCGIQPTHSRTWSCTPTMRSTDDSGVMVCTSWRELPARDAAEVAFASVGVLRPGGARPPTEVVIDFPATALSRSGGSGREGVAVVRVHRRTPDARDEPPRHCPWSRVQGHQGGRQCLDATAIPRATPVPCTPAEPALDRRPHLRCNLNSLRLRRLRQPRLRRRVRDPGVDRLVAGPT